MSTNLNWQNDVTDVASATAESGRVGNDRSHLLSRHSNVEWRIRHRRKSRMTKAQNPERSSFDSVGSCWTIERFLC
jgi:hypothetical protein